MSLNSLILRNLTVLALIDQTLAGKQVKSSLLVPINEVDRDEDGKVTPVVAVFTDQSRVDSDDVRGLGMIEADATVTVALEIACFVSAPAEKGEGIETFIPQTDEGMEMTLDLIRRQALAVLQGSNSTWAELWRAFAVKVVKMSDVRGASIENGVRFAARRFEMELKPISDPTPNGDLPELWEKVFTAFEADDRVSAMVPLLRAAAAGEVLPEWRQVQQQLGLTLAGVRAMGIAPLEGSTTNETVTSATQLIGENADQAIDITVSAGGATIAIDGGDPIELVEAATGG